LHFTSADEEKNRSNSASCKKFLSSLGVVLFHALDYGLPENEERSLEPSLEILIERLTSADSEAVQQNINGQDHEAASQDSGDEGIERDSGEEDSLEPGLSFDAVLEVFIRHYYALIIFASKQ
jgi:spire-like protein